MAFNIASYVYHTMSPKGADAELMARNLLLVTDPEWFGLTPAVGFTLCTFAVPGYERKGSGGERLEIAPFGTPHLDLQNSVPESMWTPHERSILMAGGVVTSKDRFRYQFLWVNPSAMWVANDKLELVSGQVIVFNEQNDAQTTAPSADIADQSQVQTPPLVLRDASGRVIDQSEDGETASNDLKTDSQLP